MKYNKLIRDKIIEIIEANGEKPVYHILNEVEYKQELVKKLTEEYQELLEAIKEDNIDAIVEESADLLEVVRAINEMKKTTFDVVLQKMEKKREKRGGFGKQIFLEDVI